MGVDGSKMIGCFFFCPQSPVGNWGWLPLIVESITYFRQVLMCSRPPGEREALLLFLCTEAINKFTFSPHTARCCTVQSILCWWACKRMKENGCRAECFWTAICWFKRKKNKLFLLKAQRGDWKQGIYATENKIFHYIWIKTTTKLAKKWPDKLINQAAKKLLFNNVSTQWVR